MKSIDQEINLKLPVPEINRILEALGKLPYTDVYHLVEKIQQQAQYQLEEQNKPIGNKI